VATIVFFHAHPDDESIATGGTMARAVAEGHRTVLVLATRGELGEVDDGVLADGESLGQRRTIEAIRSAAVLGAGRVEFLGYRDSGMVDLDSNNDPEAFWMADQEEASERLAEILREESADLLIAYDDEGGYGHPDHIQVHRVGHAAGRLTGTRVIEATMNRDALRRLMAQSREQGIDFGEEGPSEEASFGKPEAVITHTVDVAAFVDQKKQSMRAHASQINDSSFFMVMPEEAFAAAFGQEWFIDPSSPRAPDAPMRDWVLS